MKAYINLKTPTNTTSGISDFFLVAPTSDFVDGGIKCPPAPVDGDPMGTGITIVDDHEFVVGRGFAKVVAAPEKNDFTGKTIGDLGFSKLDLAAKFVVAGSYAEVHEQVASMLNVPLIVLFKDSECSANMWYQLGCECTSAYLETEWATGTTKDGQKGYVMTFKWQNPYVQLYNTVNGPEILAD